MRYLAAFCLIAVGCSNHNQAAKRERESVLLSGVEDGGLLPTLKGHSWYSSFKVRLKTDKVEYLLNCSAPADGKEVRSLLARVGRNIDVRISDDGSWVSLGTIGCPTGKS